MERSYQPHRSFLDVIGHSNVIFFALVVLLDRRSYGDVAEAVRLVKGGDRLLVAFAKLFAITAVPKTQRGWGQKNAFTQIAGVEKPVAFDGNMDELFSGAPGD